MMDHKAFWLALDRLLIACQLIIEHPRHAPHPTRPAQIYPVDYGYLRETRSSNGGRLDIFVGTGPSNPMGVVGVVNTVDLVKRSGAMILLVRCNPNEIRQVMAFLNTERQYALYTPRPHSLPFSPPPPPDEDDDRTQPRPLY